MDDHLSKFRAYNREKELIRRERERKEQDWERELIQAMNASTPVSYTHLDVYKRQLVL